MNNSNDSKNNITNNVYTSKATKSKTRSTTATFTTMTATAKTTKTTATPPRDAPHLKKEGSADQGDVTSSDTFDLESHKKRLTPPDLPTDDSSESPTKKTKVE